MMELNDPVSATVAAHQLKVSRRTVLNWLKSGQLRGELQTWGGRRGMWLINQAEVERMAKERDVTESS